MSDYFSNPLTPGPQQFTHELLPLMSTIRSQGNSSGEIHYGDLRDSRQWVSFFGPFDFEALRAVYTFADSIQLVGEPGAGLPRIEFYGSSGDVRFSIGSKGGVTPGFTRANRRWRKRWNRKPRDRVFFDNPYFPQWEPLVRSGRRVLAAESLQAALFPLLAAEAARGNYGWDGTGRGSRYVLNHRIDLAALRAEFDFGPGIHLNDENNTITFDAEDSQRVAFTIVGKRGNGTKPSVDMHARWWRLHNADPSDRRQFLNPWG